MDCCGMPMSVREGGGLMCRRCGETVGVPVVLPRNPFDVAVTEAPAEVPKAVVIPGVIPEPVVVAVEKVYDEVLRWPGTDYGHNDPPAVVAPVAVADDVPRGRRKGSR